ncbi:8051_t:CDS:2 [Ambispora gerdemannii]|uniref:8051_t:CDS:1 n=1 Tax=Ambispora gerdemannii TaxID=144530 RepID=A0A9N8YPH3_9GLOM|nr:8051_t:CDS:2 [Ambispora gerdemannii]
MNLPTLERATFASHPARIHAEQEEDRVDIIAVHSQEIAVKTENALVMSRRSQKQPWVKKQKSLSSIKTGKASLQLLPLINQVDFYLAYTKIKLIAKSRRSMSSITTDKRRNLAARYGTWERVSWVTFDNFPTLGRRPSQFVSVLPNDLVIWPLRNSCNTIFAMPLLDLNTLLDEVKDVHARGNADVVENSVPG